jgi:glycine cleavage system aminomethyltransferase T
VPPDYAAPDTKLQVEYFAERVAATVRLDCLVDPEMERMRVRPARLAVPAMQ